MLLRLEDDVSRAAVHSLISDTHTDLCVIFNCVSVWLRPRLCVVLKSSSLSRDVLLLTGLVQAD